MGMLTGSVLLAALAFVNGEFEDPAKFGRVNDSVEILRTCGWNGSGGLRLTPASDAIGYCKAYEHRLETDFVPRPGVKYVLSLVRRKTEGVSTGFFWQVWKKGWCLGQNHNVKVTPIGGGWEKVELPLYYENKDWQDGEWRYYVSVSAEREAKMVEAPCLDVDTLAIREDDPEWILANVWPTHNSVWGDKGHVRFHSRFIGPFIPEGGEAAYQFTLRDAAGKTLASKRLKPGKRTFTVEFGRIAYRGRATLDVVLKDVKSRKTCGSKTIEVKVIDPMVPGKDKVVITEDGRTLVDGKPFMPLGFYTGFGDKGHPEIEKAKANMKKIHDAGFNTIMEYWQTSYETPDLNNEFFRALEANELRLLFNLSGGYRGETQTHLDRAAKNLANHPPLLGWYILDEASYTHLPALRKLRRGLNELDPDHPTWQVNIRDLAPFLDVADVLGGDHYWIGRHQGCLKKMDDYLAEAASCGAATMWYCPQCFNWANYQGNCMNDREKYLKQDIEPPVNQMLGISFLYASRGVKGFIYYHFNEIFMGPVPELYEKRWQDVCEVGAVMKGLEPFILANKPIEELDVLDLEGATRAVKMTDGKGHFRVLVIGLDYANESMVKLPKECLKLKPQFGNATIEGGNLHFKAGVRSCEYLK